MFGDIINFHSTEGAKIQSIIEGRLAVLRLQLEDPAVDEREAQAKRGAIAELKQMLGGEFPVVKSPRYSFSQLQDTNRGVA
jgi:hypothetical protein